MSGFDLESMRELFTHEMNQLVDQLEQTLINSESGYTSADIDEIFRIMHTIKGSAAMMLFNTIVTATHAAEDLFYYLREERPAGVDYSELTDHVLHCMDFVKEELIKIEEKTPADGDPSEIAGNINGFLAKIKGATAAKKPSKSADEMEEMARLLDKDGVSSVRTEADAIYSKSPFGAHKFKAKVRFDEGAQMENVRAFTVINNLRPYCMGITFEPEDIYSEESIVQIRKNGFQITFSSDKSYAEIMEIINKSIYLRDVLLEEFTNASVAQDGLNTFFVHLKYDEGAQMENVRAFTVIHNLKMHTEYLLHLPENLINEDSADIVRGRGLKIDMVTYKSYEEVLDMLSQTIYLRELEVIDMGAQPEIEKKEETKEVRVEVPPPVAPVAPVIAQKKEEPPAFEAYETWATLSASIDQEEQTRERDETMTNVTKQDEHIGVDGMSAQSGAADKDEAAQSAMRKASSSAVINVNVNKLDQLLKMMGELVISEAMVTQNKELEGLPLENFHKDARRLKQIIKGVQDTVMDMRMVSLSNTFFKMNRIVRDMCKSLEKEAVLEVVGENTEVDKNIIEHIGDPLMHIVRNSLDHGIETPERRKALGKSPKGRILLEAKNAGSEVWIIIEDDGAGLNKERILEKAKVQGLLRKPEEEYSDKEIFNFIFMPGFSTNDVVTSYSGRGVGMDVVNKSLEAVGGHVVVESVPGEGSSFTLKIPLTLAIIEGMIISLDGAKYTIPIVAIRDSFRPNTKDMFMDPSGNEMITVRGNHYNVIRLHEFFGLEGNFRNTEDGIMMILESGDQAICLFVDDLIGEMSVVRKPIPKYINNIRGISGCTLLGNGDISLIVDVAGFFD